ncbi:MAG: hypothetical protein JST93_26950 [Acidobacteria bacterium]|nr:hypothetical protein [Acidobacteriota bacterium]
MLAVAGSMAGQNLQLTVTEGDGLEVKAGSRSFGGVSIVVSDGMGNPVPAAKVTFRLPESGPSGLFPNGKRFEDQVSDATGKASTWGIQWGPVLGDCRVSILAQASGASAGTTARIRIVGKDGEPKPAPPPASAPPPEKPKVASFEVEIAKKPPAIPAAAAEVAVEPQIAEQAPVKRPGVMLTRTEGNEERISSGRAKWVVITLGIVGAAGGFAAYRLNGKQPTAAPAAVVTGPILTLSNPTITIGKP